MRRQQRDAALARIATAAQRQADMAEKPTEPEPDSRLETDADAPAPEPQSDAEPGNGEGNADGNNPLALLDQHPREEEDPLVYLAFRLPKSQRRRVHRRCLDYGINVQDFGRMAVELLLMEMDRRGS